MQIFTRQRRYLTGTLILLGAILASGSAFSQQTCTKLVVTGHPDFSPVSWQSGATLEGFGPMLMKALARQTHLPLVINNMGSWGKAQQAVMSGKADVIYGLYKTPERSQWLSYVATPIFTDAWGILVPKGKEFIYNDRRSLIGKRGVTTDGESFEADLDEWIATRLSVRRVPNQTTVLDALKKGNLDYAIVSLTSALDEKQRNKIQENFVLISEDFLSTSMYIAVGRESPCRKIVEGFSGTILAWKKDGTLDKLLKQAILTRNEMTQ